LCRARGSFRATKFYLYHTRIKNARGKSFARCVLDPSVFQSKFVSVISPENLMFFFVALSILTLGFTYVGWRLIEPANLAAPWSLFAWLAWFGFMLLPPLNLLLRLVRGKCGANTLMSWLTYLSMGVPNYLFLLILLRDFFGLVIWGIQKTASSVFAAQASSFILHDAAQHVGSQHEPRHSRAYGRNPIVWRVCRTASPENR